VIRQRLAASDMARCPAYVISILSFHLHLCPSSDLFPPDFPINLCEQRNNVKRNNEKGKKQRKKEVSIEGTEEREKQGKVEGKAGRRINICINGRKNVHFEI
jgi:hypothetical protein